jgi:hypothetical protein
VSWVFSEGRCRYRSTYGRAFFGTWAAIISVFVALPAWNALSSGGFSWVFSLAAWGRRDRERVVAYLRVLNPAIGA